MKELFSPVIKHKLRTRILASMVASPEVGVELLRHLELPQKGYAHYSAGSRKIITCVKGSFVHEWPSCRRWCAAYMPEDRSSCEREDHIWKLLYGPEGEVHGSARGTETLLVAQQINYRAIGHWTVEQTGNVLVWNYLISVLWWEETRYLKWLLIIKQDKWFQCHSVLKRVDKKCRGCENQRMWRPEDAKNRGSFAVFLAWE